MYSQQQVLPYTNSKLSDIYIHLFNTYVRHTPAFLQVINSLNMELVHGTLKFDQIAMSSNKRTY